MTYYYPRMACTLEIPETAATRAGAAANGGTNTITVDVRIKKATWVVNNHNEADTLSLSCEAFDISVDPRLLKHAFVRFWMADAPPGEPFDTSADAVRFVGIAKRVHRQSHEGSTEIVIEVHDQTTLFLASRPYPDRGMPTFDMTLRQAYELICDHTGYPDPKSGDGAYVSSVAALRDQLVFRPAELESAVTLAKMVSPRLATLGKPQIARGESTNSWDVFVTLCASLGLLCFVEGDKVVVTTSAELYGGAGQANPISMIYGTNILDLDERVSSEFSGNGVGLRSFDPELGQVIEVAYPDPGDPRIFRKRSVAKSKKTNPNEFLAEKYEWFDMYSVTNVETLRNIAIGAYEERSRQEIEGELKTAEMRVDNVDMLRLRAGNMIGVYIDRNQNVAARITNYEDRKRYLTDRGYSPNVAALVARNADYINLLNSNPMHVRQMIVECSDTNFEITIRYFNKINVEASVAEQNAPPPITLPTTTITP